jgi:hypothetical protein
MMPALLTTILVPPAIADTVSYTCEGARAEVVLRELSERTGLNLQASPVTKDETLVLAVKDAPVAELLDRIAWSVGGSWKVDGETRWLSRTSSDLTDERKRDFAREVGIFRQAIERRQAELAKMGAFDDAKLKELAAMVGPAIRASRGEDPDYNKMANFERKLGTEGPAGRAIKRLVSLYRPEDLANLPTDIKVVYSTKPTRLQRPLLPGSAPVIASMQRDYRRWAEVAANIEIGSRDENEYIPDSIPREADAQIGKVLLSVYKPSMLGGVLMFELTIAAANGRQLNKTSSVLAYTDLEQFNPEKPKEGETFYTPTPIQRAFSARTQSTEGRTELQSKLMNPVANDPVGMAIGPLAAEMAKSRQANVVMCAPDLAVMIASVMSLDKVPYSAIETMLGLLFESEASGGWQSFRPISAASARARRADRILLGQYIARLAQPKSLSFEEQAYWAYRLKISQEDNPFPSLLAGLVQPSGFGGGASYDSKFLQLYGSFTSVQRRAAEGSGLPIRSLSNEQRSLVDRMVFGQNSNLTVDGEAAREQGLDSALIHASIYREPTEALANGFDPEAYIQVTKTTHDAAFTVGRPGRMDFSQALTAKQLAWQKFMVTRPDLFPHGQSEPDPDRYRFGKNTDVTMRLNLTPLYYQSFDAQERRIEGDKILSYRQLPDAFRQEVETEMEYLRRTHANMQPGTGAPARVIPPTLPLR